MEELFRNGTLEMSASPLAGVAADPLWTDLPINRILVVLAVFLLVLSLRSLFQLLPHLLYCYDRTRGAVALEHSLGMARLRNLLSLTLILPFCLILARWAVAQPSFWADIPGVWSAPATIGLVCAFVLVRALCHRIFHPRRLDAETVATLRHNLYNYLPLLLSVMLLTAGILLAARLPDRTGQAVLRWEIAAAWAFSTLRSAQILGAQRAGLSTFLYLCALEIMPAALLVAFVVLF
jgi:hypothetical protein